jgi:hypothetical protein
MPKIRRGNHVFLAWVGDHGPRHVHAYKNGKLVVKWDLDNRQAMRGTITKHVLRLIEILEKDGLL